MCAVGVAAETNAHVAQRLTLRRLKCDWGEPSTAAAVRSERAVARWLGFSPLSLLEGKTGKMNWCRGLAQRT